MKRIESKRVRKARNVRKNKQTREDQISRRTHKTSYTNRLGFRVSIENSELRLTILGGTDTGAVASFFS